MHRLPDDSLTRTTPQTRQQAAQAKAWDSTAELLAQLVDLTAILAADRRIQGDPPKVPRPDWIRRGPAQRGQRAAGPGQDGYAHAIGVLRASARNSYVTAGGAA